MIKINKAIVLIILGFTIVSCGGGKALLGSATIDKSIKANTIIEGHYKNLPDFKTLVARINVDYETEKKGQNMTVSLRMQKDTIIWIKAAVLGITLAKILITPTQVSYYEKINARYFKGDFSLLSELLGTEIDFKKAQNLILGQALFDLKERKYKVSVSNAFYKLSPKKEFNLFRHLLLIQPTHFKIKRQQIIQNDASKILTVDYKNYQIINTRIFPKIIALHALVDKEVTKIELDYRKIEIDLPLRFPFRIPSGYKEIRL